MRLAKNKKSLRYGSLATAVGLAATTMFALTQASQAATLQQVMVRFDRMQASTQTTGTVCAKPSTTATEASVKVTFPTGFVLSSTLSNWTVDTTTGTASWPGAGSAVAWPGIGTATSVSGQDVTFPSGDLTVGTLYCFNWTNAAAATQPASQGSSELGSVTTQTSVPATIDTAQYATATVSFDQIQVNATVPPAFSFVLSGNTDALGNLSTAAVTSSSPARTAQVDTNAKNGWMVWAKDSSGGLHSSLASYTINSTTPGSNSTLTAGSEGYNTGVTSSQVGGTGAITVAPAFVGGSAGKGGGLNTSMQQLASSGGTADAAVLTLTNNATIKGSTPAANDYTDTITVVGAGLF
jgi:hypothetical protein